MALATNALLILRAGAVRDQTLVVALGIVLMVATLLAMAIAAQRNRQMTCEPGPSDIDAGSMLTMAFLAGAGALFAATATVLAFPYR